MNIPDELAAGKEDNEGERKELEDGMHVALTHVLSGKRERSPSRSCFNFKGASRPFKRFSRLLQRRRC